MIDAARCCAEFYEQDWVAKIMGESFHPGGLDLSRRLGASIGLGRGDRVLDVACGTGATAAALAEAFGCEVVALDMSEKNVARARERHDGVRFEIANASSLPFEDASFDVVICECAFSTFTDKAAVASEFARVLKEGGRLGLSDMCTYAPLPEGLAGMVGPWACLQDALSVEGYQRAMLDAGLRVTGYEDESQALLDLLLDLKRTLVLVGLGEMAGVLSELGLDLRSARALLDEARDLVRAGDVQYARASFSRGRARVPAPDCDPRTGCC